VDDNGGGDGAVDAERGAPGVGRGGGRHVAAADGAHMNCGARHAIEEPGLAAWLVSPECRLHCCREEREVYRWRDGDGGYGIQVCFSLDKGSSVRQNSGLLSRDPD